MHLGVLVDVVQVQSLELKYMHVPTPPISHPNLIMRTYINLAQHWRRALDCLDQTSLTNSWPAQSNNNCEPFPNHFGQSKSNVLFFFFLVQVQWAQRALSGKRMGFASFWQVAEHKH